MMVSIASGATASLVAKHINLYQQFKKLQGSNLEFKLITPQPITETYLETKLSSANTSLVAKNWT